LAGLSIALTAWTTASQDPEHSRPKSIAIIEGAVTARKVAMMEMKMSALTSVPLWVFVVTQASAQSPSVLKEAATCQGIQVVSDELKASDAEKYCRYAVSERKKVEEFWGPTWTEPIRIEVSSSFETASALETNGFNPGKIEMPLAMAKDRTGALLHEITHNYARNRNSLLREGLAVYLQDKIGGNRSFPNQGQNLHVLARRMLPSIASLDRLNSVRGDLSLVMPKRPAYILSGSFVKFLIDRYGLPQFRTLYETGSYEQAYQKSLRILEDEWRSIIQRS
jgi:hypothetical protein